MFPEAKVFHGIKIFPLSFLSGCSRFFRWWPGGGG